MPPNKGAGECARTELLRDPARCNAAIAYAATTSKSTVLFY
jgi:hypothetical protein